MKVLLDTHTLIWFLRGDTELSANAGNAIGDPKNIKFVSITTIWEAAIKVNLGKIQFGFPFEDFKTLIKINDFNVLPIEFEHALLLSALPFHHRDPFDRMLIAQAMVENLTVITKDPYFPDYGVSVLW